MFHVPNQYRITYGRLASSDDDGNNGLFLIKYRNWTFKVIASDGGDWDHVSVSLQARIPNWDEISYIKSLFWDPKDCIIQFHPPKSQYINMHPNCLHLWRPQNQKIELPPSWMIGFKGK